MLSKPLYLHSMELDVKLYTAKPCKIGILYDAIWMAVKPFEQLLDKFSKQTCTASFELTEDKITLTLRSDLNGEKQLYKNLHYRSDLLAKILALMNQGLPIEFMHLYRKGSVSYMAKAFNKNLSLPISKVEFVHPEYMVG